MRNIGKKLRNVHIFKFRVFKQNMQKNDRIAQKEKNLSYLGVKYEICVFFEKNEFKKRSH